jgi:hypothetical protein
VENAALTNRESLKAERKAAGSNLRGLLLFAIRMPALMIDNVLSYPDNMDFYGASQRNILNPVGNLGESHARDGT